MKAYVTSVGENTTLICCQMLQKYGFEVVLMDKQQDWYDKFKEFIFTADEDCIRIDADCIPNKNLLERIDTWKICNDTSLIAFAGYCAYKNNVGIVGITYYKKLGIDLIRKHWDKVTKERPETSAWRIPEVNSHALSDDTVVVGIHGFCQQARDIERNIQHKKDRGQLEDYDFDLVTALFLKQPI